MISSPKVKLLDASSAHRTHKDWVYGMPEWDENQSQRIAAARYVANPGCYAIGVCALLHPLIMSGLVPPDHPINIHAVSGWTGGGKSMIAAYTNPNDPSYTQSSVRDYALDLAHKHIGEIRAHCGLAKMPLLSPSVGNFPQGMIVHIPLHLDQLPQRTSAADIEARLEKHYRKHKLIDIMPASAENLDAEALAGQDSMQLYVLAIKSSSMFCSPRFLIISAKVRPEPLCKMSSSCSRWLKNRPHK